MPLISRNHPKIKLARQLRQRKKRDQMGLFLVEGIHHVGEAVQSGAEIVCLIYSPEQLTSSFAQQLIQEAARRGIDCLAVSREVFDTLAERENPQGLLAVTRQPHASLEALNPRNCPWGVALVSPQDPGNVGAILRTMDAVGATALFLLEDSADPFHSASVRASMGSIFWHPIVRASFDQFSGWARQFGYHLYGTSAHGSLDYREATCYDRPLILLLGSERQGLTPEQVSVCEHVIRLPMHGRVTSLNLAVAAGIMLYAILERLESEQGRAGYAAAE